MQTRDNIFRSYSWQLYPLEPRFETFHGNLYVGIYDDILFLFNLEFFLYDHDQIFKTRTNLDILNGFDTIQQQEQDIVVN